MDEKTQKYLKYGLHAAILLGAIWAAAKYVNGQEVIAALRQFNYRLAPILLGLSLGSLLFEAVRFYFLLQPFAQELSLPTVIKAYVAGQGATVLPGGDAAVDSNTAVAGVAIFRITGIFFPILVGAIVYFLFWRGTEEPQSRKGKLETARASNADI